MLDNKTILFPAISVGATKQLFIKNELHKNGKELRCYSENSVFKHPFILISAGHNYKEKTKELYDYNLDDISVLGDSGGFQIATGALEYSTDIVEKIFNWLETNTNYAINIDIPPYISSSSSRSKFDFDKCIEISKSNFEFFEKNQSGKTKYLNVLHGRNYEDLKKWYDNVYKFNFNGGWALGGTSVSLFYTLRNIFYLLKQGEFQRYKNKILIHILGITKLSVLIFFSYIQKKLNELNLNVSISFDSSYPFITAGYGNYFLFSKKTGVSNLKLSNKNINEDYNKKIKLPCSCPVCNGLLFDDLLSMTHETGFTSLFYVYLGLHNLHKLIEYKNIIDDIIQLNSKSILEEFFNLKERNIFSIIDYCFENISEADVFIEKNKNIISLFDQDCQITTEFF